MKVILLFNPESHLEWKKTYREYELSDKLAEHLNAGGCISIRFCDPMHDEIFEAKKDNE